MKSFPVLKLSKCWCLAIMWELYTIHLVYGKIKVEERWKIIGPNMFSYQTCSNWSSSECSFTNNRCRPINIAQNVNISVWRDNWRGKKYLNEIWMNAKTILDIKTYPTLLDAEMGCKGRDVLNGGIVLLMLGWFSSFVLNNSRIRLDISVYDNVIFPNMVKMRLWLSIFRCFILMCFGHPDILDFFSVVDNIGPILSTDQ